MARKTYDLPDDRKFRMLHVKQILETETDAQHSISMTRLLELLDENMISDRRTLYDDIRSLNALGTQVAIIKGETPPQLKVVKRDFSLSELKLIIDAIASSKYLSQSATQQLIDKLKMFCSRYEAETLNRQTFLANRTKRIDYNFHSYVSDISFAIEKNRQISFQYFRINVKKKRVYNKNLSVVSPWAMIYAEDYYYMMAYDGNQMRNYRVDRMEDVKVLPDTRLGEEVYEEVKKEMPFRMQSTFNLFGGEKKYVTLKGPCYYYYIIQDKFEPFLSPTVDKKTDTFTISVPVCVGDPFFGWILSMGGKITIKSQEGEGTIVWVSIPCKLIEIDRK